MWIIIIIDVMYTVNLRGHKAYFSDAEARCHEAKAE